MKTLLMPIANETNSLHLFPFVGCMLKGVDFFPIFTFSLLSNYANDKK